MQSPILFGKPDTRKEMRAALADAAKVTSEAIDRITRKWPVRNKSVVPAEDAKGLANTDYI